MTFRLGAIPWFTVLAFAFGLGCLGPVADEARPRYASVEVRRTTASQPTASQPTAVPARRSPRARVVARVKPGQELAGSHILIAYHLARRAKSSTTRTKDEAFRLALQLTVRLRKDPKLFVALAKKHSDGPTGKRGGFLGSWKRGRMVPAFDTAISSLKIGEIAGPVETAFGFHVMMRMPLPPVYAARHILISYVGASRARSTITRTKAQALAFAAKLAKQLQRTPKQFAALATKHSNGPSAVRGGSLGSWKKGRMVPQFDKTIAKLKIGQVSGVVETKFGYHVILRTRPIPKPASRP